MRRGEIDVTIAVGKIDEAARAEQCSQWKLRNLVDTLTVERADAIARPLLDQMSQDGEVAKAIRPVAWPFGGAAVRIERRQEFIERRHRARQNLGQPRRIGLEINCCASHAAVAHGCPVVQRTAAPGAVQPPVIVAAQVWHEAAPINLSLDSTAERRV